MFSSESRVRPSTYEPNMLPNLQYNTLHSIILRPRQVAQVHLHLRAPVLWRSCMNSSKSSSDAWDLRGLAVPSMSSSLIPNHCLQGSWPPFLLFRTLFNRLSQGGINQVLQGTPDLTPLCCQVLWSRSVPGG